MKGYSFINDDAKMVDFLLLSREEFLESYGYIKPEDWNATYVDMLNMLMDKGHMVEVEDVEICMYSVSGECAVVNKPCDGIKCVW